MAENTAKEARRWCLGRGGQGQGREQRQARVGHLAEPHARGREGLFGLGEEGLGGEAQEQAPRLLLARQGRDLGGPHPQVVHPERHEAAQLPAQHLVQGVGRLRQVAALAEVDAQPGVGQHERGVAHAAGNRLHQAGHGLLERRQIARRPAQRSVLERVARQGGLAEGAQAEALAVADELAIAQPFAIQSENVRRRRHGIEAQELLNPRR